MFKSGKGGSFATKIAHTSLIPLGNQDLRHLQELINNEKTVMASLSKLSADYAKASDSLKAYGASEGDDLNDVLGHSARIMGHVSAALNQLASHTLKVREHMKAIRTREEKLAELRKRRKAVGAKAEDAERKLSKMSGEHKNLPQQTDILNRLRDEMRQLDMEILRDEADVSDFKRSACKHFLTLKFGGLNEFAEKCSIVGELGRVLIDEIPLERTPPGHQRPMYQGFEKTNKIVQEVDRCVGEVVFTPSPEASGLAPPWVNTGRVSEDSTTPAMLPSVQTGGSHFGTVGSHRTENSDHVASPTAQDMPRTTEFGEESGHRSRPSTASGPHSQHLEEPPRSAFSTFPSAGRRRDDRNVSFAQSVQEALSGSPNLSSIDVSSGPPLDLQAPQSPRSPRDEATQPNPWDAPSAPERRSSWADLPEQEREKNEAAARDIGLSIFAPSEPLQRNQSVPPPPPMPAAMPALRTPSPSVMPQPLPEESYSPPQQQQQLSPTSYGPPQQLPVSSSSSYAPPPGPPPPSIYASPPSLYATPAHSYSGEPSTPGKISAAAFRRAPGLRSPSAGSSADLKRGSLPTTPSSEYPPAVGPVPGRQGTLPPYEPQVHPHRAYAEDAYATGSPTDVDYGALGPTRIHNSDQGYAQGRFATNLDRQ
ncbi:hypothetical protein AURDEDRAFT_114400 [Auricularia subglabra TFB-10046 SS5]|nr:hypothetical protein AURDEDRAFT_114400 [Auricularia subglabra TFB-10046 SS5]